MSRGRTPEHNAAVTMRLISEQRADVGLLRVTGEIDLATVPELRQTLVETIEACRAVELDLRQITFIDCVGLQAIREAEAIASESGCHLVLRRSRAIRRLESLVDGCGLRTSGKP